MSVYVIGDLQGCYPSLMALLEKIHAECADPRLIFVGDLVNRGPQSLATLRTVRELGDRAVALLGNHDLHLLAVANGFRKSHGSDTIQEVLDAKDGAELLDWLRHRPLTHFEDGHLMVHAGVLPQWTVEKTLALAQELETVLRGPDWLDFLRNMYGNQPAKWDDTLSGWDRLRCIVNALTRLRFCSADGSMELTSKEAAGNAMPGHFPWFELAGRKTADTPIVFGHWSALGLMIRPNAIALDTGCVWGGKLTALRLKDRSVLQVDCPQYLAPDWT